MGRGVTISAASPSDAALLHALTQQAWQGTVAPDSSAFRETPATLDAIFASGGGALLLRVDGEPAGSVRWLPVQHPLPTREVKRLGVLPALRGLGLARRLMNALLADAARAGVRRVQLGVRADQPRLIAFYQRHGFGLDTAVALSSINPLTAAPVTMSLRLGRPEAAGAGAQPSSLPSSHRADTER